MLLILVSCRILLKGVIRDMYLVANDRELTIKILQIETNKHVATYFYDSDFDYSLGLDMLLFLFVDS